MKADITFAPKLEPFIEVRGVVKSDKFDFSSTDFQEAALALQHEPSDFSGWPKIYRVTSKGEYVLVAAKSSGCEIALAFQRDGTHGFYQIKSLSPPSADMGDVWEVLVCPPNDRRFRVSQSFKYGFIVSTRSKAHGHPAKIWQVGFDKFTHTI